MVFSSLFFLYAFLPASLIAYALCRTLQAKNISLLVFSLIFYAWGEPKYVLLLMGMALFDWFFALRIDASDKTAARKLWLALAVITDLGLIGFFKYSGMVCSLFGPPPAFVENLALPIGISFYTFQLLTYVVDVYRGEARAQRRYWHVLLYAALFHQCIAGPIVRYQSIAAELFEQRRTGEDLSEGVLRFTLGLTKKVLLANPCGALADQMLLTEATAGDAARLAENLRHLSGQSALGLWLGVLAFALQIYLDFSAYSDMAIGMGKMLGLHYKENFDHPYISRSATEFWRRWHISLGSFFRDYVYIPLGGSRRGTARTLLNLLIVWALTGLWHGASWNFVLWGLYWFVFAAAERLFLRRLAGRLPNFLRAVLSHAYLLFVALMGWVLFRFTDIKLAGTVIRGLFGANGNPLADFQSVVEGKSNMFLLAFCIVASTPVFRKLRLWWAEKASSDAGKSLYQAVVYGILPAAMLLVSTAGLVGNSYNPFLYFKF
ncbi:MAG: MBOAT family protein [Oscillospiraceae bacterium]|nr:MBOAT family protein [Oscillospiraceae bacterium]